MKEIETPTLQIRVYDDSLRVRRRDRKPLTDADREEARRIADAEPGVTLGDVMKVFQGARVIEDDPVGGPSFQRGLRGGPCRACGQPLPLDDEGFINLWVHQCRTRRVRQ
jgi:hypothetical protein